MNAQNMTRTENWKVAEPELTFLCDLISGHSDSGKIDRRTKSHRPFAYHILMPPHKQFAQLFPATSFT